MADTFFCLHTSCDPSCTTTVYACSLNNILLNLWLKKEPFFFPHLIILLASLVLVVFFRFGSVSTNVLNLFTPCWSLFAKIAFNLSFPVCCLCELCLLLVCHLFFQSQVDFLIHFWFLGLLHFVFVFVIFILFFDQVQDV